MATLSLCSTSSPSTALSKNQTFLNTLSVPKANSNVTFLSHSFSSLNLRFSKPNSLSSFVPKYSESEAPVAEVEADQEEPVVEATSLEPKREEIFAVVMVTTHFHSCLNLCRHICLFSISKSMWGYNLDFYWKNYEVPNENLKIQRKMFQLSVTLNCFLEGNRKLIYSL